MKLELLKATIEMEKDNIMILLMIGKKAISQLYHTLQDYYTWIINHGWILHLKLKLWILVRHI